MSKPNKDARPNPRLPRGLRDIEAAELRQQQDMLAKIRAVYELYGFEPLETPAFEYTDALGKFLPDQDRPNAGVFSFQDSNEARGKADAEEWMSLRYDLTAPLARYVAQHYQDMPKPFRRYAVGPVWRNEKPGPGRFRQFMQFDADTVGAESVAADAEMCMLAADTLEALGMEPGTFVIKINNRKILDGILEAAGISTEKWLTVMRAVDKLDRLGFDGVRALLGRGRRDESGDFTDGANLSDSQIEWIETLWRPVELPGFQFGTIGDSGSFALSRLDAAGSRDVHTVGLASYIDNERTLDAWETLFSKAPKSVEGVRELRSIISICKAAGFESKRIRVDSSVVRGLEYYTGPVFEAEIMTEATYSGGTPVRFGSVGGGGRYDDLVARFTGQKVPATGFSIGVSRLQAALSSLGSAKTADGPVIVTVMEKERIADYQKMVQQLREAGIRAELYLGNPKKFGKQLEYADKRGAPCVVIQGSDELAAGKVTLKDLVEGAKAAAAIKDNAAWKEQRPAQVTVDAKDLVAEVKKIIARHAS